MSSAGIDLNITIGALLIGTYVSVSLFGFTTMQSYSYFLHYREDRWFMKGLVRALCVVHMLLPR